MAGIDAWLSNHPLFFSELERGHKFTIAVAQYICAMGVMANVTPLSKRETVDDRTLYYDEPDIVVPGKPGKPDLIIEVKARNLVFHSKLDYPYRTAFVDTVRGWDQKARKPIAVVLVSQLTCGMAVVRGSTSKYWRKKRAYDNVRGITDEFYTVHKKLLVDLADLVDHLKLLSGNALTTKA